VSESLAEIGEEEIINRLKRFMPFGQSDDDTALLNTFKKNVLVNTDVLVEGTHFSKNTTSPQDIGWRAITANLSDLASNGVDQVLGITVGLVAPPQTQWEWVEGVYNGIWEALERFGGNVLGGDCSSGQQKLLAITAIGTPGPLRLQRSQAIPGDWLVTSGPHGLSRLGLALLNSDPLANSDQLSKALKSKAILAHQRPMPPLKALRALESCKPTLLPWRAGGTDSSDGLIQAVKNLCRSSGCQAVLDPKKIPKNDDWPLGSHWDNWCINGGEDFELVLSLPSMWAKNLIKVLPNSKAIGYMENGPPNIIWGDSRDPITECSDFKHF